MVPNIAVKFKVIKYMIIVLKSYKYNKELSESINN